MSSNKGAIAKNTIYLYIRMLAVMLVSLYTSRVVLSVLGASDYGIYNVVGGIVSIMAMLNGTLSSSTSRFLTFALGSNDVEELNKTFSTSLNLHISVAFIVLVLAETIGLWFLNNKIVLPDERRLAAFWVYQFSVITMMFNFTQVPYSASLISHENMSIYAIVGLYDAFAKLAIAFLIKVSPIDNLIFYAFLLMANTIIVQLFYRTYTKRNYSECRFRLVKDKTLYIKLLKYSGWEMFGSMATVSQGQGINIILNLCFGPIVNAARAIVIQIETAVMQLINNFLIAVRPQVIKNCAEGNFVEMYRLSFYASKFSFILMLAMIIPLCFDIDFVLNIWLGDEVPQYTNVFAVLVLISCMFSSIHRASLMPYHAIGRIKTGNIVGGSLMIASLPISYILFKFGMPPYWAFIVIIFTNTAQQFITWIIIHGYVHFSYKQLIMDVYIPCFFILIISVIPSLIIMQTPLVGWQRFLVLLMATEVILLMATCFIGLKNDERKRIIEFIKNRILHDGIKNS